MRSIARLAFATMAAAFVAACSGGGPGDAQPLDAMRCFDRSPDAAGVADAPKGAAVPPPATLEVVYLGPGDVDSYRQPCEEFPPDGKRAVVAATSAWSGIVRSAVPIRISLCWTDFTKTDPAYAGVTGVAAGLRTYRNFPNAPLRDVCYVKALANALAGRDLDPGHYDLQISYNAGLAVDWYFGGDGNAGSRQMDLAHVVAHEIAHGLGFRGSMEYDVSSGRGTWGVDGFPLAWDTFVTGGEGKPLLDPPGASVGAQLVGGNLRFAGPNARRANAGAPVKIFAPSAWMPGSSYMHLDYDTFHRTTNELMVHDFDLGPTTNAPGPVVTGILEDLGWTVSAR